MEKKIIRLTEQDLHIIVKESVNKILVKEFDDWDAYLQQDDDEPNSFIYDDGTEDDYNGNYAELIKNEMHNMAELERQVPKCYRAEIHSMISALQGILSDIRTRDNIAAI